MNKYYKLLDTEDSGNMAGLSMSETQGLKIRYGNWSQVWGLGYAYKSICHVKEYFLSSKQWGENNDFFFKVMYTQILYNYNIENGYSI